MERPHSCSAGVYAAVDRVRLADPGDVAAGPRRRGPQHSRPRRAQGADRPACGPDQRESNRSRQMENDNGSDPAGTRRQARPDGRRRARQGRLCAQLSLAQGQGTARHQGEPLPLREHEVELEARNLEPTAKRRRSSPRSSTARASRCCARRPKAASSTARSRRAISPPGDRGGFAVNRTQIALNAPIKTIGMHKVPVALHPGGRGDDQRHGRAQCRRGRSGSRAARTSRSRARGGGGSRPQRPRRKPSSSRRRPRRGARGAKRGAAEGSRRRPGENEEQDWRLRGRMALVPNRRRPLRRYSSRRLGAVTRRRRRGCGGCRQRLAGSGHPASSPRFRDGGLPASRADCCRSGLARG